MQVLHSKKILFREELQKVLTAENKKIDDFPGLMDFILRMESVRQELRLTQENWNKFFSPKTSVPHDRLETYIRILLNLNMYLNVHKKMKKPLNFQYKSNISKNWIKNSSFYFEAVISFFNYGVLYFNSGLDMINSTKDASEARQALNNFRISFWGFQETYQSRRFCLSTGRLPQEISNDNLELYMACCVAFGYLSMCRAMGQQLGNLPIKERCRLYCAVGKHLTHAHSIITRKVKGKQFLALDSFIQDIIYYKNLYYCMTFFEMSEDYRKQHEERVTGGFIGWQLGYLLALREVYNGLCGLKNKSRLASSKALLTEVQRVLKGIDRVQLENNEVYKAKIPKKKDLLLKEPSNKLKSLDRPNCKSIMPELRKVFNNKKSQKFNRIMADLDVVINTNRNNLFGLIDKISKKKMFIYQDLKVDTLLSSVSAGNAAKVQKALREIRNDYGGYMGYLTLTNNLQQLSTKNDEVAKSIMHQMQKDRDGDFAFQRQTGIKIPSLKESNPEVVGQFEKHGVGLTALKKKDKELMLDFDKYSDTLQKVEDDVFEKELSKLGEGLGKIEGADQLMKYDTVINQWFDGRILVKKKEILEFYKSLDLQEMVVNIYMNRFSEEKTFIDLNEKLDNRTEELKDFIEKQHSALNKMAEIARKVNLQVSAHKGVLEKKQRLVSTINGAALLYTMLLTNLELHTNFERALRLISDSIRDYLTSKELQKQEIMNERRGGGGGGNSNAGGGYFGAPQGPSPNGGKPGPGGPGGANNVSAFLSDILKEQGFDFKF